MRISRALLMASLVGGAAYYAKRSDDNLFGRRADGESAGVFVSVPQAAGHAPGTVYVVAAQNCTRDAARRADDLSRELIERGITAQRVSQLNFQVEGGVTHDMVEQLNEIMNGPLPIVFVNGRAASNPTFDQVMAEVSSSPY
ncbi:MAG: hypothetical protein ACO3JL_15740 [Myxococcota bacterium]